MAYISDHAMDQPIDVRQTFCCGSEEFEPFDWMAFIRVSMSVENVRLLLSSDPVGLELSACIEYGGVL